MSRWFWDQESLRTLEGIAAFFSILSLFNSYTGSGIGVPCAARPDVCLCVGCAQVCVHTCAHTCTCTHTRGRGGTLIVRGSYISQIMPSVGRQETSSFAAWEYENLGFLLNMLAP